MCQVLELLYLTQLTVENILLDIPDVLQSVSIEREPRLSKAYERTLLKDLHWDDKLFFEFSSLWVKSLLGFLFDNSD